MMKRLIPIIITLLAGAASGSLWLYDETLYVQDTTHFVAPYFKPMNMSPFEIVNAPYFNLVGDNFSPKGASPVLQSTAPVTQITSKGATTPSIPPVTFSGNYENNLKYAESKSSLRVGESGSWSSVQNPWLIK